ncbi:MAG: FkbM family methyltransferase [Ilumatobacteraceae bacterium]
MERRQTSAHRKPLRAGAPQGPLDGQPAQGPSRPRGHAAHAGGRVHDPGHRAPRDPLDVVRRRRSHIGSKLVEFIRLAPGVEHLAFEPVPSKAEWLRKRFGSQAEIHEQALGAEAGVATLSEPQSIGSGYSSLRTIHEDDCLTYEVEVTTLDKEVGDREVGFIKLDLEGYELFALQGARETLQRCRPALQFECSLPDTLAGIGYDRSEIFDFLHELDYDVYLAVDFVFGRSPMCGSEFARAGQFPFPGLNYFAVPTGTEVRRLR